MSCSSCKYLKENDKKSGSSGGYVYFCSKTHKYVNGISSCDKYESSPSRTSYACNTIYNEGKSYSNDSHSVFFYLFILTIMVILAIILNILGVL